jgi:AcrR family transcriptional regulator
MEKRTLRQDKKDWTRKSILEAAKSVFLERGYAQTTMAKIAQTARVSKGAIYLYFPSKDDLFLALLIPVIQDLGKLFGELKEKVTHDPQITGKDVVLGFYLCFKRIYEDDPDAFSIMRAFQIGVLTANMAEHSAAEINRMAKNNSEIGRAIIAKATEYRLVREVNPALLYNLFWGTFIGIVQLEESKFRATRKNYIFSTLEYAFLSLVDHLCTGLKGKRAHLKRLR